MSPLITLLVAFAEPPAPVEPPVESPAPTEEPVAPTVPAVPTEPIAPDVLNEPVLDEPVPDEPVPVEPAVPPAPEPPALSSPPPAPVVAPAPVPAPAAPVEPVHPEPHGGDPTPLGPALPPVEGDASYDPPVVVLPPPLPDPLAGLVPRVRARGLSTALGLTLLAALLAAGAAGLRRVNRRLGAQGALPTVVRTVEVLLRLGIVFFGLGALGSVVPTSIAPVLPIVVMAAAVALGWSARDVAQDLVAGVFIAVEGQLRAGYWVSGERYSGSVEALGLRVTWLRDVHGRRIVVPNRVLLAQPLVTDDKPWPRIQFKVRLAVDAPIRNVRKALEEAILLSPWVAPQPEMEVHPDAMDETVWHVAVRVLDSRYAHRFQGLLRERVMEIILP